MPLNWNFPAKIGPKTGKQVMVVAPAWPAEPVGVAQPATRRMQAGTPLVLVAERGMRPDRIVMASPALNDDLGLAQSVEDLAAEQLIATAGVEALDVAVLPRTAAVTAAGGASPCRCQSKHPSSDVTSCLSKFL